MKKASKRAKTIIKAKYYQNSTHSTGLQCTEGIYVEGEHCQHEMNLQVNANKRSFTGSDKDLNSETVSNAILSQKEDFYAVSVCRRGEKKINKEGSISTEKTLC